MPALNNYTALKQLSAKAVRTAPSPDFPGDAAIAAWSLVLAQPPGFPREMAARVRLLASQSVKMGNERNMVARGEVCACCPLPGHIGNVTGSLFHLSCAFSIAALAAGAAVPQLGALLGSEDGEVALAPSCSSSALLYSALLQVGPKVVQELFKSLPTNTNNQKSIYLHSLGQANLEI